jgi:hypothetical protein
MTWHMESANAASVAGRMGTNVSDMRAEGL